MSSILKVVFHSAGASAFFEMEYYTVQEGDDNVTICAVLTDIPDDGLECEVVIFFISTNGKAGTYMLLCV